MLKAVAAVLIIGVAACAAPTPPPEPEMPPSTAVTDSIDVLYGIVKGYVTASAEQASDALYRYRATPDVRTFGQILGHVADANRMMCGAVVGEDVSAATSVEETVTAKADLQQALADTFALCDRAFAAVDDESGGEPLVLEAAGLELTRLGVLSFAVAHQFEHYGNLVTYMRLNGMVPPSSQPAPQAGM